MITPAIFTSDKPHSSQPPLVHHHKKADDALELAGKRAVIVEDEGITQLQLSRILRLEGLLVVGTATNGQEAIDVVLATRPDLVLMDIRMPVMDGLEATERILAEYRVCIVMLTAFSDEEYRKRAEALETCGYVLKPVTAETLMPQLKAAFEKFHFPA